MSVDAKMPKSGNKSILIILACVIMAAGLAFGGYTIYEKSSSRQLSPEESRKAVTKYLKKKSGRSDFEASLDRIKGDKRPWETLAKQYDTAGDYETVYRLIGEHLSIAQALLKSSEQREQRAGRILIKEISGIAQDVAVDDWLACRICDGYLVPMFKNDDKLSDEDEQLIYFVRHKYEAAEETQNEIELMKFYLSKTDSGRRADGVRYRLARLLKSIGQQEEAQKILKETGAPDKKPTAVDKKATNNTAKN